jgi:hypothetical protein
MVVRVINIDLETALYKPLRQELGTLFETAIVVGNATRTDNCDFHEINL